MSGTIYGYDRSNNDYGTISTTGSWTLLTNATGVATPNAIGGRMAALDGVNYMVDASSGNPRIGRFSGGTAGSTWSAIGGTNATFVSMVLASDGQSLYGLVPSTTSAATLYRINTTNGALTKVVDVTASPASMPIQFSAAAFAVVPEPSTIVLALSGVAVFATSLRFRRRTKV